MGFDEAEQGLGVDKRTMQRILSMLQSGINAMADLQQGSALVVYALTPDIVESMENFPGPPATSFRPYSDQGLL